MDRNNLTHTRWNCIYHIVFIPKYGRKIIYGKTKNEMRDILKKLCVFKKVEILEETVCSDHMHLYKNTAKTKCF